MYTRSLLFAIYFQLLVHALAILVFTATRAFDLCVAACSRKHKSRLLTIEDIYSIFPSPGLSNCSSFAGGKVRSQM